MQIYLDIFLNNNKNRLFLNNSNDLITTSYTVDDINDNTLEYLLQNNLAISTIFGIKLNATAFELDGHHIDNMGFKLGGYTDNQDTENTSYNDFIQLLTTGDYEEILENNEKYYFEQDTGNLAKVIVLEKISDNLFTLQNKPGMYSYSLLFNSEIELKIYLCETYLFSSSLINTHTFKLYLKDIFTPANIIIYTEEILSLLKQPYGFNVEIQEQDHKLKKIANYELYDYAILTMDVLLRLHNLYVSIGKYNDDFFANYSYVTAFVKNNIKNIYKPVNFHYNSILKETGLDIPEWYLEHNISVKKYDFFI